MHRSQPVDAVLAVTYGCNSRCHMCNIWQLTPEGELAPEDLAGLPPTLQEVNISGGEPFLRDDLPQIVAEVRTACNRPRVIISTNGFLTRRIAETMREVLRIEPRVAVGVSIDGVGETHDTVRGVPGAFGKCCDTIEALKTVGVRDLRLSFTATKENQGHVARVRELARSLGVGMTMGIAHSSEFFFHAGREETELASPQTTIREIEDLALDELLTLHPKSWFRAYFYHSLAEFVRGGERAIPCTAGSDYIFVDPHGDVYPCNILNRKMGNLKTGWDLSPDIRKTVENCPHPCWMICTSRQNIKRKAWSIFATWILPEKIQAHLRKRHEEAGGPLDAGCPAEKAGNE